MANYSIVADFSNFKPYDINTIFKLIDDYNKGYDLNKAVYDKIAQTLGTLESSVQNTTDAKAIYDQYQNSFNEAANDFATGMTTRNSSQLAKLRQLYGTEIMRLEQARLQMMEEVKRRQQNNDNTMIYEDLGNLDTYLHNPTYSPRSYSGDKLRTYTSQMAAAVGQSLADAAVSGHLDQYTEKIIKQSGFKPEQINQAIAEMKQGGPGAITNQILKGVVDTAIGMTGINKWSNADQALKEAYGYIDSGLYGGIGKTDVTAQDDFGRKEALKQRYAMDLEDHKLANKAKEAALAGGAGLPGIPVPISFTDDNVAGASTKRLMAESTYDWIVKNQNNPVVKKYIDGFKQNMGIAGKIDVDLSDARVKDSIVNYFTEHGLDGRLFDATPTTDGKKRKYQAYYDLREHLRQTLRKQNNGEANENLINIWTSDYIGRPSDSPQTSSSSNLPISTPEGTKFMSYQNVKDWSGFEDNAKSAYQAVGTPLPLGDFDMKYYGAHTLESQASNGQLPLHKIKQLNPDGSVQFEDSRIEQSDLPTDKDGNIDWAKVHPIKYYGNLMFYYLDEDGSAVYVGGSPAEVGGLALQDIVQKRQYAMEQIELAQQAVNEETNPILKARNQQIIEETKRKVEQSDYSAVNDLFRIIKVKPVEFE